MVQEGSTIFAGAGLCAACHGPGGAGAIGPNLTDDEWFKGEGQFEEIVAQIMEGVVEAYAHNADVAFMQPKGGATISDVQVRSVAAYVWTLSNGGD